jgi:hypothetical protein
MTIRRIIYLGIVSVVILLAYFAWKLTARSAYESAEYTILESDSPFETREYPDLQTATTNMQFKSQGDDGSFMRLFRYISGANEQEQRVAMTTPVLMEPEADSTYGQMGFVIPKNVAEQRVPEPTSEQVHIRKRAGGRFAVIRFAGRMNRESLAKVLVEFGADAVDESRREYLRYALLTREFLRRQVMWQPMRIVAVMHVIALLLGD